MEYTSDISIIDVYELASGIGKEFEKIIDSYSPEIVSTLMPKVISSLEHLESLATKNERENAILEDLKSHIVKLEYDKHVRAEDRIKYEKELEQIEDEWRKESTNLLSVITKLQNENKRLTSIIANQNNYEQDSALGPELDDSIFNQLQNQVDNLKEKVKLQNNEISRKCTEIDELRNQIETLNSTISDFKRKQKLHNSQIIGFIDERTKLLIEIQEYRREIHKLHQQLGLVERENEDLLKSKEEDTKEPRFTTSDLREILHERNELKVKVNELEDELAVYRTETSVDAQEEEESCDIRRYDLRGKGYAGDYLALRLPDYTLQKSESLHQNIPSFFPTNMTSSFNKTELNNTELEYYDDEESPVQGPLPAEPDDAPWKKTDSGIRKLFRKLFGDQSSPTRTFQRPIFPPKASSTSSPTSSTISNS